MFTQETHPGKMPIRVLVNNVIQTMENIRPDTVQTLHRDIEQDGKVHPGISWVIEEQKLSSPYADCAGKKIVVQETYLSFVWAFTYFTLVTQEEIQQRILSNTWDGNLEYTTDLMQKALKLFNWALSLRDRYSDWDLSLPNPERYNSPEEEYYVPRVNSIFLDSVAYVLYHEYAHLVNNHCIFLSEIVSKAKTN